ncbi:hypothetical protein N7532_001216 [Penicillium argentinense]|uniref:Uncharacterized protein n=1 Tax=Penicillium argentinense TaxID=1131581 RepID=A0A9W9G219_9EURO|nr:uncharacterized protein N7532_001216 [Penicillium argentinense]KAJ5110681.1 hypothetical protein N7532_001216 [Penicillium argentinense]
MDLANEYLSLILAILLVAIVAHLFTSYFFVSFQVCRSTNLLTHTQLRRLTTRMDDLDELHRPHAQIRELEEVRLRPLDEYVVEAGRLAEENRRNYQNVEISVDRTIETLQRMPANDAPGPQRAAERLWAHSPQTRDQILRFNNRMAGRELLRDSDKIQ